MRGLNECFYWAIRKIIPKSSLLPLLICITDLLIQMWNFPALTECECNAISKLWVAANHTRASERGLCVSSQCHGLIKRKNVCLRQNFITNVNGWMDRETETFHKMEKSKLHNLHHTRMMGFYWCVVKTCTLFDLKHVRECLAIMILSITVSQSLFFVNFCVEVLC